MIREMRIRNYSECTILNYISAISQLSKYYQLSPDLISTLQLKDYVYYLIKEKQASVSSINQLISAWKIFQIDIMENKWEDFQLKRPRREKKIPSILSQSEAILLINALSNLKHRTILTLAYVSGLRRAEIINLKPGDIDSPRNVIRVIKGKGNKSREVSIPSQLILLLRKYYRKYHPKVYLFEGDIPGKSYSVTSVGNITKRAARRAGIKKNVSPHTLRHCFATHMLERGVNLKRLQMMLGHCSMKTTSTYLHLAKPGNAELPDLLNPVND